jgi:hypothetical protein
LVRIRSIPIKTINLIHPKISICKPLFQRLAEKVIFSRLIKNAQMQGASFDRLRINSPEE